MSRQVTLTKKKHVLVVYSAIIVMAVVSVLLFTVIKTPQAKTSTGEVVQEPYSMMVDNKEVMLVKSPEEGEQALKDVVRQYTPEGSSQTKVQYDKNIEFKKKTIRPFDEIDVVLTEDEAARKIIEENQDEDPLFTATVVSEESIEKSIKPVIRFEYKEDMTYFEYKVKNKGKEGKKVVLYEIKSENGQVVAKEKVDTEILEKSKDAVVETGFDEIPKDLRWTDYDMFHDEVEKEKNSDTDVGERMIQYGEKHLGAPYKRGGKSFETGIDCGNFVVEVYAKFGMTITRSIAKQGQLGRSVSLKNARPGDIVYYGNHVALYMGDGKVIHARKKGLTIDNINYKKWISIRQIDKRQ